MGKTIISEDNRFEWDKDKNLANIEKHGIAFEEILEVFDDPAFLTGYDFEHSEKEGMILRNWKFKWHIDSVGLFYREEEQNTVNIRTASR